VPCAAAHNYFSDFPPVVTAKGGLHLWPSDGCTSSSSSSSGKPSGGLSRGPRPPAGSSLAGSHVAASPQGGGGNEGGDLQESSGNASDESGEVQGPIVFVRRGGCSFAEKVLNILHVGAAGLLAGGDTVVATERESAPISTVVIIDTPPAGDQVANAATAATAASATSAASAEVLRGDFLPRPAPFGASLASSDVPFALPQAPGLGDTRGVQVPVVMVASEVGRRLFGGAAHGGDTTHARASGAKRRADDEPLDDAGGLLFAGESAASQSGGRLAGRVELVSATLDSLRGRGRCQCQVESPDTMREWHFMHREGLKERLDFVVDEGKRALMCFSHVRTVKAIAALAHLVTRCVFPWVYLLGASLALSRASRVLDGRFY